MTLQETKEIVLRWLNGCETKPQLDLILEVIDRFVYKRFEGVVPKLDLDIAKTELQEAWLDRKLMVVKNNP